MRLGDHRKVGGILLAAIVAAGLAGGPARSEGITAGAAVAVAAELEIEEELLAQALAKYAEHVRRRGRAIDRLSALHSSLDEAVRSGQERISALLEEVERAEAERAELMTVQHVLVARIDAHRRRIDLLRVKLESLQSEEDKEAGVLTGRWEVVLLPLEQRGIFSLRQTGALVTGTYTLEGGWTGSLEGTLIDGKVHLVRIDSRLGRSMELEGRISADKERITGNWLNYELADGESSNGQWAARKSASGP